MPPRYPAGYFEERETSPEIDESKHPRAHEHENPHSEWQLTVSGVMRAKEHSLQDLVDDLANRGSIMNRGRLWRWLRNRKGYPPEKNYSEKLNADLAKCLGLDPTALQNAYENSRRHFQPQSKAKEELLLLRQKFQSKATWTKAEAVKLLDQTLKRLES